MSSTKFTHRDLIFPAIIVICSLTFAQDPTTEYTDLMEEDLEIGEELIPVTPVATAYPPDRSNVYPYVKEKAPPFHFAVWDETGKICILAKLEASFTITYETKYGKQQIIDRITTNDATSDGRCESFLDEKPVMDIKWRGGFTFRLIFDKNPFDKSWKIETLELLYNTADSLFRDGQNGVPILAKSKDLSLAAFDTRLDRSYFCPNTPTINLYDQQGEPVVLVRLFSMQVQAFKVKQAKFSAIQHCGQVGFGAGVASPFLKDDNGMIVITFSIYIFASISTVLGYAGYRAWFTKKYDYGTMA